MSLFIRFGYVTAPSIVALRVQGEPPDKKAAAGEQAVEARSAGARESDAPPEPPPSSPIRSPLFRSTLVS